ncbi:MAG: bifunctional folylpolyglutamate synthase/dihydrofolate synthase [Victivallaceae bacterium]|nr:bifunctional folylpolyglutamate synthase/dihydrofolate synthase [Victivallaceae bacterium]
MHSYQEALRYLDELQLFGIKLGLDQTRELMAAAGSPERELKFIHIAGSNGKGSCGAMLHAALRRAGFSTGFYSSPHLISPRERFRVNGAAIGEAEFAELVSELRPSAEKMAAAGRCPTYFEFTTVMAARHFARRQVDLVIWETGLGGRFDATNVVDPVCAVITGIAPEHQQYLGSRPEQIAFEKAGIIKPCRPVVIGGMADEVRNVILRRADEVNAPVLETAAAPIVDLELHRLNSGWIQKFDFGKYRVNLALPGALQRKNFRVAFTVLEYLAAEFGFSLTAALAGLEQAFWPARCQWLPDGIIIDGAHNPDGITALAEALREFIGEQRIPVIFGGFKDKNTLGCLKAIESRAEYFVFLPLAAGFRASWSGGELAALLAEISGKKAVVAADPAEALELTEGNALRLVCGSLYLAGEFLKLLVPEQEVLNL